MLDGDDRRHSSFQKRAKRHHLVGHRWILGSVAWFSDQTLPAIRNNHRKALARYDAIRSALARGLLRRVTPPAGTRPRQTQPDPRSHIRNRP